MELAHKAQIFEKHYRANIPYYRPITTTITILKLLHFMNYNKLLIVTKFSISVLFFFLGRSTMTNLITLTDNVHKSREMHKLN